MRGKRKDKRKRTNVENSLQLLETFWAFTQGIFMGPLVSHVVCCD